MSKKKEGKKPETKQLISSQVELMQIRIGALKEAVNVMQQRRNGINSSINVIALELGVPEEQLGEWGLSEDGKTLIRVGRKKRFPGLTTVKQREKKKKPSKNQQPDKEE